MLCGPPPDKTTVAAEPLSICDPIKLTPCTVSTVRLLWSEDEVFKI